MELNVNQTYKIVAKVESLNHGVHFCNTTILTTNGEHINIKLDFDQLPLLSMGKVYQFEAQAIVKIEDERLSSDCFTLIFEFFLTEFF